MSYNGLFEEGDTNYRAHGGKSIINPETIPQQKLLLSTHLQAIAARINIGRDLTKISVYNSRSYPKSGEPLINPLPATT